MHKILILLRYIGVSEYLSILSVLVGIIPLVFLRDAQYNAVIYVFGFYLFILVITLVWREYSFSRKSRYAEANKNIHACMHSIRDAHTYINLRKKDEVLKNIGKLLDSLSDAYTLITGTQCRCCIKSIVIVDPNNIYTETFARSGSSNRTTIHGANSEKKDLISITENTDFSTILLKGKSHYLCDDLTKEPAYRNSNWPKDPEEFKDFISKRKYQYKATLVLPIRHDIDYIGFLCIDSLSSGVFERRYDVDTGAIVADTLYFLLKRFKDEGAFDS